MRCERLRSVPHSPREILTERRNRRIGRCTRNGSPFHRSIPPGTLFPWCADRPERFTQLALCPTRTT